MGATQNATFRRVKGGCYSARGLCFVMIFLSMTLYLS
jgi:hypothetical protein